MLNYLKGSSFIMKNKGILALSIIFIISIFIVAAFIYNDRTKLKELTIEEKLEDFRYMYHILEENYPHFHEIKEMYNWDWLAHKEYYEKKIAETENNMEFYNEIDSILRMLQDGHTGMVSPKFYYSAFYGYKEAKEKDEWGYELFKPWADIWLSAEKKYRGWYELFREKYPHFYNSEPEEVPEMIKAEYKNNVVTEIIEDEKIAYLKIKSFSVDSTEEIVNFLKSVKGYPYLIIDIMDNSGGSDSNWYKMVNLLLNENKKVEYNILIRGGEYSKQFLESKVYSNFNKEDITKCPYYNELPDYVKKNFKYYLWKNEQFYSKEHSLGFNGDIYLLVNSGIFSSADHLVHVFKQTNLGTIVGSTTGGVGVGVAPWVISLPNSGLIVRFEGQIGLNEDGTSNFKGTKPDIEIQEVPGEDYNKKVIQETINIIYSKESGSI